MSQVSEKIHPDGARADAARSPDRIRDWIVVGRPGALDGVPWQTSGSASAPQNRLLPLIGGRGLRCSYSDALALAERPEIEALWAYDSDLFGQVVGAIAGLDYSLRNGAHVASMSMGPGKAAARVMRHDPAEPLNRATRKATEAGMIIVVAAGNYGPEAGIVNPWCASWTINVGAATADGQTLADFSARGLPGTLDRPTIVGPGVDIMTTHPPGIAKTRRQQESDAACLAFLDQTPDELRDQRPAASGTSFATPQIAGMATRIAWCFDDQLRQLDTQKDGPDAFALRLPSAPGNGPAIPRRAGILVDVGGVAHAAYPLATFKGATRAQTVKQILVDLAGPMPDYGLHEVGAGFVSPAHLDAALGEVTPPEPQIMAVKAFLS